MHDINLVISSLRGGGAERAAVQLCNGWSAQGLSVVLTTLSDGQDDDYALSNAVDRITLQLESESNSALGGISANVKRILALRKSLKKTTARHVIGFSSTSNILIILASFGLGHKVIVVERNYPPKSMRSDLWKKLRKHLYRFADHVVVQTQAGADWLAENTSSKDISVIPNSVSLPIPAGEPVVETSQLVPQNKRLLLAVGNIQPQKGFDLLLDAIKKTQILGSNWLLVVIGAGDASSLLQQVNESKLHEHVHVVGRVGNVGDWYLRADAFVLSSRYEGFPNVLLEAMASACAVVSFDCTTGPADIIEHGNNGLLVSPEDSDALSVALSRVMGDEALREQLRKNAPSVLQSYSTEKLFANWERLISKPGKI